jgi:trichohyalin
MRQSLLNMPMIRMQRWEKATIYLSMAVSGCYILARYYLERREKQFELQEQTEQEKQQEEQLRRLQTERQERERQYEIERQEREQQREIEREIKRQEKPWKYCEDMAEQIQKWKTNPETLWPQKKMDKYSRKIILQLRKEPGGVLQALDNYSAWFSPKILEQSRVLERINIRCMLRNSPEERARRQERKRQEKIERQEREQQREIEREKIEQRFETLEKHFAALTDEEAAQLFRELKELYPELFPEKNKEENHNEIKIEQIQEQEEIQEINEIQEQEEIKNMNLKWQNYIKERDESMIQREF